MLLQEDHSLPLITLHTFYRVGSRNESTGATGLAHLIEHMMFNGAAKYGPKEFDRVIESLGGYSNAYTDLDITVYHETLFPDGLDDVLDMEADRISSNFDPESFATESGVVREERRLSSEEDVMGALSELLWSQAYCAHPYHTPVVGWMSDLENLRPEQAHAFFQRYYVASNCVLVARGRLRLRGGQDADHGGARRDRARQALGETGGRASPRRGASAAACCARTPSWRRSSWPGTCRPPPRRTTRCSWSSRVCSPAAAPRGSSTSWRRIWG